MNRSSEPSWSASRRLPRRAAEGKQTKLHIARWGTGAVALVSALLFAGTTAAVAGPGSAAGTASSAGQLAAPSCQAGRTCLWPHANFRGSAYYFKGDYADFRRLSRPAGCTHAGFNDCASSAYNDGRQCTVYLWTSINYRGSYHSLSRGDYIVDFGSRSGPPAGYGDPSFNDSVSSLHWCTPR